ncbi:Flagellar biosynthesis protein FlhF [Pseudobythopirellula maris]|uniref:Flagellar biosynthesis protein FlhF n=1 Tax=Pseudobythopirellula maris TaxID=2527991 RepID=A0A5C5ZGT7_9BACT|nr:flagellar biosynthesis protein FlhF [Pseudobythopirellula maris]TWT86534.1 Flagellar biosynthesis protein FlhF [Pseudobythopirellula maris]
MSDVRTYRAKTLRDALRLVRDELGPDASVLHTKEVGGGLWGRAWGGRRVEVAASATASVPSRFAEPTDSLLPPIFSATIDDEFQDRPQAGPSEPAPDDFFDACVEEKSEPEPSPFADYAAQYREDFRRMQAGEAPAEKPAEKPLPETLFALFTDLLEADVDERIARGLLERVTQGLEPEATSNPHLLRQRLLSEVERRLTAGGPIATQPGACRTVALVGPTGVGKTTTIAKLAANFRLRDKLRVGLITVDTYRVAAVEQLRTYADIIDLPMEVVSTPREMREAVERLSHLDLVLMDTAGRSPKDAVRVQELRALLAEAQPDEVHLVLSVPTTPRGLSQAVERFAPVGVTSVLLTKLDEAPCLGHLLGFAESSDLPISYLTDGQNVPDDIRVAEPEGLARLVTGMSPAGEGPVGMGDASEGRAA